MAWTDGLNSQQRCAIDARTHVALIAGPGTGKTRTLLGKALQLVEDELATAAEIRLVNFTNAGVRDLKRKILTDSSYSRLSHQQVSTFHSMAFRSLLAVEARDIPRPVVVLDDWEERMFIDRLVNAELGLRDVRKAKKLRDDYNARWCQAAEDVDAWMNDERRRFEQVYRSSQDALRFVTRGELTFLWWKHLRANPGASTAELRIPYLYLLVDEYQDLNECEHEILRMLAAVGVTIFAVGDPNQSIYEIMRHAHPEFCANFPARLGAGELHVLDESYRCPEMVLRAGIALLSDRKGIPDPRRAKTTGEVAILRFPDDTGEVSGLAQLARHELARTPESRVLVAVPTRNLARPFVAELRRLGVAVDDRTARDQSSDDECRYARALVNLTKDRSHSVAAATALILRCAPTTRESRGVELVRLTYDHSTPAAGLLFGSIDLGRALTISRGRVLSDLHRLALAEDPAGELTRITGCQNSPWADSCDDDLAEMTEDPAQLEPGKATVMTLHSCKGLEAELVILPAVEPGFHEQGSAGRDKDERRRLLYVGITRALETAILSYADRRYGPDRYRDPTSPSPRKGRSSFIDEIACDQDLAPHAAGDYLRSRLTS